MSSLFKRWSKFARGSAAASKSPPPDGLQDGVHDVVQEVPQPASQDRARAVSAGSYLAYRRFLRSAFRAPARLNLVGQLIPVQLLDVSLKGALVDLGPNARRPPLGTRGHLRLPLSATSVIAMDVEVARVQGSCLGLRCLHIDLDSVTHLRELMQRNLPDPSVLERDLGLLAQR